MPTFFPKEIDTNFYIENSKNTERNLVHCHYGMQEHQPYIVRRPYDIQHYVHNRKNRFDQKILNTRLWDCLGK